MQSWFCQASLFLNLMHISFNRNWSAADWLQKAVTIDFETRSEYYAKQIKTTNHFAILCINTQETRNLSIAEIPISDLYNTHGIREKLNLIVICSIIKIFH